MCKFFEVSRSEYYDFVKRTGKPEQDTEWQCNGGKFLLYSKTECIYRHKPKTFQEADDLIDKYIHFYNYERIQTKTGMAPLTLRHSA